MTAKRFFETTLESGRVDELIASGAWSNQLLDDQVTKVGR